MTSIKPTSLTLSLLMYFSLGAMEQAYQIDTQSIGSQNYLLLGLSPEQVEKIMGRLPKELYAEIVKNTIITCVDVFVLDVVNKQYAVVYRKDRPAKDSWFVIGGRQNKGESFFDCARRKCSEELGIEVTPLAQLSNYSTVFADSEWGCQTHTNNQVVFAVVTNASSAKTDEHHEKHRWIALDTSPNDIQDVIINPYFMGIYREALTFIARSLAKY